MTKLVLSEIGHEAAAILTELNGADSVFMDGPGGDEQHAGAHAPRHVHRRRHHARSSATRSASASSASPATR